jgi:hypothetical protein
MDKGGDSARKIRRNYRRECCRKMMQGRDSAATESGES